MLFGRSGREHAERDGENASAKASDEDSRVSAVTGILARRALTTSGLK